MKSGTPEARTNKLHGIVKHISRIHHGCYPHRITPCHIGCNMGLRWRITIRNALGVHKCNNGRLVIQRLAPSSLVNSYYTPVEAYSQSMCSLYYRHPPHNNGCLHCDKNVGGKDFNQAIALTKARFSVAFAGAIIAYRAFLYDFLRELRVDVLHIRESVKTSRHALIQAIQQGRNGISLYGWRHKPGEQLRNV